MKKLTILHNPVHLHDLSLDELYDGSDSWQLKAERLIQRQQKRLRLKNV